MPLTRQSDRLLLEARLDRGSARLADRIVPIDGPAATTPAASPGVSCRPASRCTCIRRRPGCRGRGHGGGRGRLPPTWCWRRTTPPTYTAASSRCTNHGDSRNVGGGAGRAVAEPAAPAPSGLTIHLLEHGRFRVAAASRAFPATMGWPMCHQCQVSVRKPVRKSILSRAPLK